MSGQNRENRIPHDNAAEQAFLGALLINPRALNDTIGYITPDDFYHERHRIIFKNMLEMFNTTDNIDIITLTNRIKENGKLKESGGTEYLNELLDTVPTSANLEYYGRIIRNKSILRTLIKTAGTINAMAMDSEQSVETICNIAERKIFEITNRNLTQTHLPIGEILHDAVKKITEAKNHQGITGLQTGFSDLDNLTSGLQSHQLIIIAGRPGSGKTAFCLNLATRAALITKRPVLYFSLEMGKEELCNRILVSEAKVDNTRLRHGMYTKKDMQQIINTASKLYESKIIIDDKPDITVTEARAKARRIKQEHGDLALVVFDYLQLVEGPPDIPTHDRYAIISDVSRSLKYLAKELQVPVIALSQLSRKIEERTDHRPQLSDLRESGQIEQDADIVAFIHREALYSNDPEKKNEALLYVKKHRNGEQKDIPLTFIGEYMRFDNSTRKEPNQ